MTKYSENIKRWLEENEVASEFLSFDQSVHSVKEAVEVSGYPLENFTKTILMIGESGELIVAVVPGSSRASTERVRKYLNLPYRPRIASDEESQNLAGQMLGGNSPFNIKDAIILIDPKVLENEWIVTGGGDSNHLVKVKISELQKVVKYTETRVRK